MNNLKLIRVPVALMWIYEGLWCKVLGLVPRQAAVIGSVPFLSPISAHRVLIGVGLFECVIAIWVLSGWRAVRAAIVQIALLVGMNGCGLLWARNFIPDPLGMIIQNLTFVTLILLATGEVSIAPKGTDSQLTAWNAGRFDGRRRDAQLLFGQMFEDPCIEIDAFAGKERIFCIASAGCTAMALAAAGHQVTAVDVNPSQISYVEARLRGGDVQEGKADQLLARGRRFLPLFGWREPVLRQFLELQDLAEQIEFWEAHLNTLRWRGMLDVLLHRSLLQIAYASAFTDSLPQHFGRKVRQRIERNWRTHANRSNPYAWRLLIGHQNSSAKVVSPRTGLKLTCADAATYLEDCPSDHFDGFTLSNIFDGASTEYRSRLLNAVRKTAAKGAVVVRRSFGEPADAQEEHWATRDKAMLWGSVSVTKIEPD